MSEKTLSINIKADIGDFKNAMAQVSSKVKEAGNTVKSSLDGAEGSAKKGVSGIKSALGGVAGILAGAFAIDKIKDFGVSLIESAADGQAMTAQFEQVFGGLQGEAAKAIDGMGKEFGMVGNRIKPAMSTMTSMFKGLGMDTKEAMDTASQAVSVVADSAAFYDLSFEDANSALNSFIKGNYEGGEAIGLFANDTQLAAYASKELGQDWKTLDEKGKQLARIDFAKSMQEAAGATGQASRESDSYTNQLGNLKQIWTDLKAKLGTPILATAIASIKGLADMVKNVDTDAIIKGFKNFGSYVVDVFTPIVSAVKDNFKEMFGGGMDTSTLSTAFEKVKTAISGAGEVIKSITTALGWFIDKFDFLIVGVLAGVLTFKAIAAAQALWTTAIGVWSAVTKAAAAVQLAFNAVLSANPIGIVVLAIGALVAIGILLYKNWDTVTAFLSKSWEMIKTTASSVWDSLKTYFSNTWNSIKEKAVSLFESLKTWFNNTWNSIKTGISNVWNGIKSFLSSVWNGIVAVGKAVWDGFKTYLTTAFNLYKTIIMTVWNTIKTFLSTTFNAIKSVATTVWNAIKTAISTTVEGIKTKVSNTFNSIRSTATTVFNGIKSAMTKPVEAAKTAISKAIDKIKGFFSGLKLKFPKISMPKMPKFTMSGKFSLSPPSVPKVGVEFYKDGGIMNKATAFGMNGSNKMIGGEAGSEAILPLNKKVLGDIGRGIASTMKKNQSNNPQDGSIVINFNVDKMTGTQKEAESLASQIVNSLSRVGVRYK